MDLEVATREIQTEPRVSIIVPCRNEEDFIDASMTSILSQKEPSGGFEVVLVDGRSEDKTLRKARMIAANDERLIVLDNPKKLVSTGMNIGIEHARGEIILRMDAHCDYPNDYVRRLVDLLETSGADNVGGVLVAIGKTGIQEAIGAAYRTPIGTGVALRAHPEDGRVCEVDAVWGGCWWRSRLYEIGLFDETMVRNQDDELCFRLRELGGKVLQSSSIRISYHVRDSFRRLFGQYLQYGFWKVRLIHKHKKHSRPRHYIPALFVIYLLAFSLGALFYPSLVWALATGVIIYAASVVLFASREAAISGWRLLPGIVIAMAAMHFGYGFGFILGVANLMVGLPSKTSFQHLTR